MIWHEFLTLGIKYLRLHKLPAILLKQPKVFLLPKHSTQYLRVSSNFGRLSKYIGNYSQANSLVKTIYKSIISGSTQQRSNSLLRIYRGFAGSVQLRHYATSRPDYSFHPINKIYKPKHESWFSNIFATNKYQVLPNLCTNSADSINPKEFIAAGCNSAVWAAEVRQQYPNDHESIDKFAVKVLYNYYTKSSYDRQSNLNNDYNSFQNIPESWVLLHRQIQRECELRPQTNHPNIVPLVGYFIDRAPQIHSINDACVHTDNYNELHNTLSSSKVSQVSVHKPVQSKCWPSIENFSEGFDNRPYTFYMLMPRFEGTLDDLLQGNLQFNYEQLPTEINDEKIIEFSQNSHSNANLLHINQHEKNFFISNTTTTNNNNNNTNTNSNDFSSSNLFNSVYIKHGKMYLSIDDIVTILVQLFEAIAELEHNNIAHRDIKPNNILIRQRIPYYKIHRISNMNNTIRSHLNWLNDKKLQMTNSHFHVALTDFGCAIRTGHRNHHANDNNNHEYPNHSGNLALLAPEIAQIIHSSIDDDSNNPHSMITNKDYAHSDLWAAATLIYPLFGIPNPFVDGTLSSVNYTEDSLPELPNEAPKIMTWILHKCLKRNPSERPSADEIADILHTWCLIRHFHNRQEDDVFKDIFQCPINLLTINISSSAAEFKNSTKSHKILNNELISRLCDLLSICWAGDWLSGAARPPNGIRSLFYSRATPGRLALCLSVVQQLECFNV
ncbi:unnamed protein product [Schistosoma turkestanicum]|nr:unnamed protein product [Schistosoma turkestanicum]